MLAIVVLAGFCLLLSPASTIVESQSATWGKAIASSIADIAPVFIDVGFPCIESCEVNLLNCIPLFITFFQHIISLNPIAFIMGCFGCVFGLGVGCIPCYLCGLTCTTATTSSQQPQYMMVQRGCFLPHLIICYMFYDHVADYMQKNEDNKKMDNLMRERIMYFQ